MMRSLSAYRSGWLVAGVAVVALFFAAPALAAAPPMWSIQSVAAPTAMQTTDAVSAVQRVTVTATGGTFTLSFEEQETKRIATTKQIAYNASTATVESELGALSTIGGAGGSMSVTEDPGNEPDEHSYVVTFGAKLH